MSVFADADEGEINRVRGERSADVRDNRERILFSIQQMIAADTGFIDEPFEQISTEARGMVDRKADVLVEMEHLDA